MGARPVPAPLQPDHNRVFVVQHKGVLFADCVTALLCVWSTHILRSLTTNLRRGECPCGGCRGMRHPGESLIDAVSNRTLTVRPQQGIRRSAQRRAFRRLRDGAVVRVVG